MGVQSNKYDMDALRTINKFTKNMKFKNWKYIISFLLFLLGNEVIEASVLITEVMTCNLSSHLDRGSWNFPGYVELYNSDSVAVSLKGYVFEHHNRTSKGKYKYKWDWTVSENVEIPAQSYVLLYFDKDSLVSMHSSRKLDSDGGIIYLRDANENLVDMITYQPMVAHIAYGFDSLGRDGYMLPTPGKVNMRSFGTLSERVDSLYFDGATPGIQEGEVSVSFKCNTERVKIHYTTDGSEPTENSPLWDDSALTVDTTVTIKARAYSDSLLPSEILVGTFIFMDEFHASCGGFSVPIVSISIDDKFYNDDSLGIAVLGVNGIIGNCTSYPANFNQDWKRTAAFEYIVDGKQVLSEEVEVGISGGCTRSYTEMPKSLKIKTGKKVGSGKEFFDYEFFKDRSGKKYDALKIRAGGNAYNAFFLRFRDGYFHSLAREMNVDYQAYQPVAYYLNGKYQGMMGLREHLDEGYIVSNYGLEEDALDMIKTNEVNSGDKIAYNALVSFLDNNDPQDSFYYEQASQMMDMEEYIDYVIIEQFSTNIDWPGNNIMCWRDRENGKFRWILYDMDATLGCSGSDVSVDPIKWCTGEVEERTWANNMKWKIVIFSNLIKNPKFRERYLNRWMMYLGTTLSSQNIKSVYDSLATEVSNEFCATFDGLSPLNCDGKTYLMGNANERIQTILSSLAENYGYTWNVGLKFSSNVENVRFVMNGEVVNKTSFSGYYFNGKRLRLEAYAPSNYKLTRWNLSFVDTSYSVNTEVLDIVLKKRCSITAVFEPIECQRPTVIINELCASTDSTSDGLVDDYGLYPDWVELFNYGEDTVNVAGLYLTDKLTKLTKYQIPYSYENTKIAPHDYLIVWADGKNFRGAMHTNFKLENAKGAQLALVQVCEDTTLIDQVSYVKMQSNGSYGRKNDGAENWRVFVPMLDSLSEGDVSFVTPMMENGSRNAFTLSCPMLDSVVKIYDGEPLAYEVMTHSAYHEDEAVVEYSVDSGANWSTVVPEIVDKGSLYVNVRATHPKYDTIECEYILYVKKPDVENELTKLLTANDEEMQGDEYRIYDIQGRLVRKSNTMDGLCDGLFGVYFISVLKETESLSYYRVFFKKE